FIFQKPYLRSTSIQCYLCLLLNSHFFKEAGIHVFILGCISAGLPKTEANWQYVIHDLETIERLIQSMHMDATLYTESDAHVSIFCFQHCCLFQLFTVSIQSSGYGKVRSISKNLTILADRNLSSIENKTELGCKECEELEEKSIKEFLKSFVHIVQMFNTS
uniref:Interleukin n=1 Tax=Capra hircus TaxID=9925 RepID=A0A8C2P4V6_CAPHI